VDHVAPPSALVAFQRQLTPPAGALNAATSPVVVSMMLGHSL